MSSKSKDWPSFTATTAQARSPVFGIGQADDGHVGHRRVGVEQVLDLLGGDVLAVADDHVLQPTGDGHVAVGVDDAQVAAAEVAVVVEGVGVEGRVEVAAG